MCIGVLLHGAVSALGQGQDVRGWVHWWTAWASGWALGLAGLCCVGFVLLLAVLCVAGCPGSIIAATKDTVMGCVAVDLGCLSLVLVCFALLSMGYSLGLLLSLCI